MRRILSIPVAASLIAFSASSGRADADPPRVNAKLKQKLITIHAVVLLPPEVEFNKLGAKGFEGETPQAHQIKAILYSVIARELEVRGVHVLTTSLDQTEDDAAKYTLADLRNRYETIAVQVRKKPDGVKKGRFTLGDRVAAFEPGASSDALVFIRASGFSTTTTRKAIAFATLNIATMQPQFHGELAFVDAKTGELLVFTRFALYRDATEKTETRLANQVRGALHNVPFPQPPPKR